MQANDTECIGLVSIPPSQQGEFRNPKCRTQRRKRLKFNNLGPPRSPFFHHGGTKTWVGYLVTFFEQVKVTGY